MSDPLDDGTELIAQLYESLKFAHKTLFEHSQKLKAMETAFQLFPAAKHAYDEALKETKTEYVHEHELAMKGFDVVIAKFRSGRHQWI